MISDEPAVTDIPLCKPCKGTGTVAGLLRPLDCMDCHGTGVELMHAIGVIKAQKQRLAAAEKAYRKLKSDFYHAVTPAEVLEGRSVDRFYADSRINKHD